MKTLRHPWVVPLLLIITTAIFYGNTLQNSFVHDDIGQIVENIYIHSFAYLPKVITGCIWESALGGCNTTTNYYRPLQSLSYLLTYQISSKPWLFHLINLLYFTIVGYLVFLLTRLLTKKYGIALLAGAIFLVHPINSNVANWIATVPDLLSGIFALAAVISYFLYRDRKNPYYFPLACIFFTLGIFSKETAVVIPGIFILLDLVFFKVRLSHLANWKYIKTYLICTIITALYIILRIRVLGGLGTANPLGLTAGKHFYIAVDLFTLYLKKIFWPYPLQFSYANHPTFRMLGVEWGALVVAAGYLGLLVTAWKKRWKTLLFALAWFILFLLPSLIFIGSIDTYGINIFSERYLFVPSIGVSIVLALMLSGLIQWGKSGKYAGAVLMGAVCILSFTIIHKRNSAWVNDFTMYRDSLVKNPGDDIIEYDLAIIERDRGNLNEAKSLLTGVVKQGTWYALEKAYNNLGDIYRREGKTDEAIKNFEQSIRVNPTHVEAYNNLGALYLEKGDLLQSLTTLCLSNRINPAFKPVNDNYDRLTGIISGMDDINFTILFGSLMKGPVFQSSPDRLAVRFKSKDCSIQQGCMLRFATSLTPNAFLLPFLIAGQTENGKIARARFVEFQPNIQEIAVGVDRQFGDENLTYIFPTCDKVYYKAHN